MNSCDKQPDNWMTGLRFLFRILYRTSFLAILAMIFLPIDLGNKSEDGSGINPLQTLFAAKEAVSDIVGICTRKPEICEIGREAIATMLHRAVESASFALDLIGDDKTPETDQLSAHDKSVQPPVKASDAVLTNVEPTTTGSVPLPSSRPSKGLLP